MQAMLKKIVLLLFRIICVIFKNYEKTIVYDIVYKPVKTVLINKAKEKNCKIIFGYEMLLGQAIRSFEIWLDRKAPYDVMKRSILGGF